MTTTHRPATETSAGRFRLPPLCCRWPDENVTAPHITERHRQRLVAHHRARNISKHTPAGWRPHDTIQWPPLPAHPHHIRHAPSSLLPMPAELAEGLDELDDVAAYADEIEVETPSPAAFDNARRLLKAMYRTSQRRFSVYPAAGGHIAIDARGGNGRITVVSCGSDGSVLCLATIDGNDRQARYSSAHNLPDAFIREALAEL